MRSLHSFRSYIFLNDDNMHDNNLRHTHEYLNDPPVILVVSEFVFKPHSPKNPQDFPKQWTFANNHQLFKSKGSTSSSLANLCKNAERFLKSQNPQRFQGSIIKTSAFNTAPSFSLARSREAVSQHKFSRRRSGLFLLRIFNNCRKKRAKLGPVFMRSRSHNWAAWNESKFVQLIGHILLRALKRRHAIHDGFATGAREHNWQRLHETWDENRELIEGELWQAAQANYKWVICKQVIRKKNA